MGAIGLTKRSQTGFTYIHFMCLKSSLETYADTSTTFPGPVIYPRAVSEETNAQAVTAKSETPGNKSRITWRRPVEVDRSSCCQQTLLVAYGAQIVLVSDLWRV